MCFLSFEEADLAWSKLLFTAKGEIFFSQFTIGLNNDLLTRNYLQNIIRNHMTLSFLKMLLLSVAFYL